MKKNNSILPISETNDPDEIIKNDKKRLTIYLIIGMVSVCLYVLTAFITYCAIGNVGMAFAVLFIGPLMMVILLVLINLAHNSSRRAAAVLKLTEVVTGDDPIPDELLDQVILNRQLLNKATETVKDDEEEKKD